MSENLPLPVYTINVGTPGQFTDDADVDISSTLNAELAAAPSIDQIKVVFNPGNYGVANTILLPSNTTVIGNGAELCFLPGANGGSPNGSALISNAASYYVSNNAYLENLDGTYTEVPYTTATTARVATTYSAILINTNISVSGLVFNETGSVTNGDNYVDVDGNTFGTWFTNCTNIDVSNNLYIGGNDGNAFVNVQNGIVSNNIAIGNLCAFDNWNGTSNVTIADNQVWQKSINDNSAFAGVQINSTPNGNPITQGNIYNDSVVGDSFAGNTIWQSAVNSNPLLDHGPSSENQITETGNIDTSLGGYTQGFYSSGPISNIEVEDNVVAGAEIPKSVEPGVINIVGSGITNATISGNLIYDASVAASSIPVILAPGPSVMVTGNASLSETVDGQQNALVTNAAANDGLSNSTNSSGVPPAWIEVPSDLIVTDQPETVQGVSIQNENTNTNLTLTVIAQFGYISSIDSKSLSAINAYDQSSLVFTGNITQINQDLTTLTYAPTAGNNTDAIELIATSSAGEISTSYIPVLNETSSSSVNDVVTISSGFIAASDSFSANGTTGGSSSPPPLLGDILAVISGDNVLNMGSLDSQAYLGTGNSTVIGGSLDEYIAAGAGTASVDLAGGGNVTFAGSSGSSTINTSSGNDLIEAGAGAINIVQGNNALTVIGGLGTINYSGGSGGSLIATLPESAGNLNAQLGTGNSTVEALSGNDTITSQNATNNLVVLGAGADLVNSNGNDLIYAGTGSDTIQVSSSSKGSLVGGGGMITLVDGGLSVTFFGTKDTESSLTALANGLLSDTVNFRVGEIYNSSSADFLMSNQFLNMVGNDQAVVYAANQDTVNIEGAGNVLILAPNSSIPLQNKQATMFGGSSVVNVNGASIALIETTDNSITGANGANITVSEGGNTVTGQEVDLSVSGTGNKFLLSGADTVISASPYSHESSNMPLTVQNEMTVQSGRFNLGGLDVLDQVSGTAAISLFGGNKITLNGSSDSITASDQIYGGNVITNNGNGNFVTLVNMESAATTIVANASILVNVTDSNASMIGGANNYNANENLTFIAGTGTSNTIFGAGSNASMTLFGGSSSSNLVYGGRRGGNLLDGGSGGMDYFVGGGNGDVLIGGKTGQNTLVAGTGSETLVGAGLGNDVFSVVGGGDDTIEHFTGCLTINSALSVIAKTDVGGSLVVTLNDSTKITFTGLANLTQTGNVFSLS